MPKKLLVFGASNSQNSINRAFANYAASQLEDVEINLIDLNDYEMPLYSIDREKESGIPELARQFKKLVNETDGILISFAEHNGAYTVAFKNIFDWISRVEKDIWANKPMLLLSTSPGGRGGQNVLQLALNTFKFMNNNTLIGFSLPSYPKNFSAEQGILDEALRQTFAEKISEFQGVLNQAGS